MTLMERLRSTAPHTPAGLLATSFLALIGVGTLLLWLPLSHRGDVGLLDALFTATSAVCVTGLVVVDTGTAFTPVGQATILVLIQMGGLGVMTFAAIASEVLGRRLTLSAHAALADSLIQRDASLEFAETFHRILRVVLLVEAVGGALLFAALAPHLGVAAAAWSALFHAVSAFCNAGFSLNADSLVGFRENPLVTGPVMALIVLGGAGHPVLVDVWRVLRRRDRATITGRFGALTLHSRVVVLASGGLIALGAILLLALGLAGGGVHEALFQSVTARTAGFNTVDIGALPAGSLVLLVVLMFIGGSSGSCAGGVKTSTVVVWFARFRATLRGEKQPRVLGRHLPGELVRRAMLVLDLAIIWNVVGVFVLLVTEGVPPGGVVEILFEQVSAFATVGLSTGLTPQLSEGGRLWIIVTMFVGRVGPLTVVLWLFARRAPRVLYPDGRLMIG